MNWIFESPVTISVLGGAIVFFLVLGWVQTGKNAFLAGAGGAIVVAILLLVMEKYVVTDSEAVRATVYEIAEDLETNEPANLTKHIVQSKPAMKDQAAKEMGNHHFDDVTIGTIHRVIENPKHQPPEVEIEFNVSVSGVFFGNIARENEGRWVRLVFWKEDDGKWRIADYEHNEPTFFMKKRPEKK